VAGTPMTVPEAVAEAAARWPDGEALVDGAVRLSWAQLSAEVTTFARFLIAEGVPLGGRVAVQSPNTWHWVVAALGTLSAGATLVPISTRFTAAEALDVLHRSHAHALVIAEEFLGTDRLAQLRDAGLIGPATIVRVPVGDESCGHADRDGTAWRDLAARAADVTLDEASSRAGEVRPEQVSDVLFTSGTTGRSKGAMSGHAQALGVAEAWAERAELTDRDRYLVVNPFFHSFGYKAGILACLLRGTTILPMAVFDAPEAMRLIERERVSVLPGAPTLYRTLLDSPARAEHDLASLRIAVTGAATVPVALIEEMRAELSFDTVLTAYGLTEAVVATMCRAGDDAETVAHTCGRAASGFEVRVDGQTGEVLLRGPNVMLGYLDDPAATAEAIDPAGWLHTGDVGRLDERGYLTITDRLKDMYICGGFNVYPAEVEQSLARLPGVAESAVIGVPDERLGEVGRAYVVPRPGASLAVQDVLDHCATLLAGYKRPREVRFRDQLPRNAAGKVLKTILRGETT
jgi:HIP---CoA ligase